MSSLLAISSVEKLSAHHQVAKFKCGKHTLDYYLRAHALKNQLLESSQTYVVHRNLTVLGYMSLSFGSVSLDEIPAEMTGNMPPAYRVPIMLLARLAIDKSEQGKGLGKGLLKEAFLKTTAAADIAGLRAILVDAIDEQAAAYYKKLGFVECPGHPQKLMISIQDVRASL